MHDRRVVRGNTFAALVIPVNMQPDPVSAEKQKAQAINRRRMQDKLIREQEQHQRQQQMQ